MFYTKWLPVGRNQDENNRFYVNLRNECCWRTNLYS